jgi:hypothetical protein
MAAAALLLSASRARAQQPSADSTRIAADSTQASADSAEASVPQRDVMDILGQILHGKPEKPTVGAPPGLVLTLLPAFSINPATGLLVGVAVNGLKRLGPRETTNASTASLSVNYTTKQQFNVLARSNIFGSGNSFLLQGDWRYLDTSQPTYGLGPAQPEDQKDDLQYNLIRIYQTAYRQVTGQLLMGFGYHLNDYFNIVDPKAEQGLPSPVLDYNGGQKVTTMISSGLSADLVYDNRDNPIYATRGIYMSASLRMFPTWLGSDNTWQSFQSDLRTYGRLDGAGRHVFATWATTWFTFGSPPYLELPAIGWDTYARSGRGYPQGRVRGNNQIYLEGEYRVTLSADGFWGAAAFLNLLSTSDPTTGAFKHVDPGGGLGLRIKLNKHSSTNITLDYGFGAHGSNGLFMGTGEAF